MAVYWRNVWEVLAELAPWLIFGLLVAGVLHAWLPTGFVRRHLGGPGLVSVVKAALLGVPMPLCSCSVIPTAIGMRQDGASAGASVGFLISTPQTGVDSIAVSAAFLGLPFAVFKVASAFLTGVVGGWLVDLRDDGDGAAAARPVTAPAPPRSFRERLTVTVTYADELLHMIWVWIVLGVLASALITTLAPNDAWVSVAWAQGVRGMLVMLVIAVPLYVCATASVPVAAALVAAGLPGGAALVFLMAGPATNVATIGAVYRAFGRRALVVYLLVVTSGSFVLGLLFDRFCGASAAVRAQAHGHGGMAGTVAAVLLVALLVRYAAGGLRRRFARAPATAAQENVVLRVSGMTCQGCAGRVAAALEKMPGVSAVAVELKTGNVTVAGRELSHAALAEAVRGVGFKVVADGDADR